MPTYDFLHVLRERGDALLAKVDLEDFSTSDNTLSRHYFSTR